MVTAATAEHHEHTPSGRVARWVERAVATGCPGSQPASTSGCRPEPSPSSSRSTTPSWADRDSTPRPFGSVLAGLATAPAHIHHDGNQHGIQLAIRPEAARPLFGCPAGEFAARSHERADVLGRGAARLREQLHEVASWPARFSLVEQWLAGLASSRTSRHVAPAEVAEAWRVIELSAGAVPIRAVADHVDWSMRRLQERFGAEFGMSPKAAARVRRFERSVPLGVCRGGRSRRRVGRAQKLGAPVDRPVEDSDYGSRGCSIRDPEGNSWSFGTYTG